ncbi:MAG: M20/M25/M40 family metallo-hydrolase [Solirubrobacterales bacterium]
MPEGLTFAGRPQLLARFAGTSGGRSPFQRPSTSSRPSHGRAGPATRSRPRSATVGSIGRGACDMKGGVAAMVIAAETLAAEALPGGELLVNTVTDEEWNGAGSLAAVAHGVSADAGVIPEATGFEPWIACWGS